MDPSQYQPDAAPVELQPHLKIWRYVDTLRLLSLLETRSLFFPRADKLGDPHEGALGTPNVQKFRQRLTGLAEEERDREIAKWNQQRQTLLRSFAISGWHVNERESVAMWDLRSARSCYSIDDRSSSRRHSAKSTRHPNEHGRVLRLRDT
jgi:hypothetical protein